MNEQHPTGQDPRDAEAAAAAAEYAARHGQDAPHPTSPTQRIEPTPATDAYPNVAAPEAPYPASAQAGQQPAPQQHPAAQAPAGQAPWTAQAAQQGQPGTQPGEPAQGAQPTSGAWGQPAWHSAAPQLAPEQQQSNPYQGYVPGWESHPQQHAAKAGRRRKAARWGIAAGALALAVTLGAVPGWALGHHAGVEQASGQSQAQGFGGQNGNGFGSNGSSGDGSSNGQGTDPFGGSDGSSGGQQFQQLPFENFGNGTDPFGGSNGGSSNGSAQSDVQQGTKLDSGVAGLVMINTTLTGGEGAGTGMILSSDGYVLTNYHVVEGSTKVQVTDSTTGKTYVGEVVGHDQTHDVALVKLANASGLKTVQTSASGVSEGDTVHAVGNSSGEGYLRKLTGKVTGTNQSITTQAEATSEGEKLSNLIETDADVVPGYSGGALVNDAGQVVGMTTAASSGNTSATVDGYAIPISEALQIANQIKDGQSSDTVQIGRGAALGISVLSADTGQVGGGYGVTVQEVINGGAVDGSGLAAGDTIIGLDSKSVKSYDALKSILAGHKPGDKVELVWLNSAGKQVTKTVTLGESTVN